MKDQYFQYVFEQAEKLDQKVLLENRSKFLLVHSSSGFKHSLTEVMQEPAVTSKLQDTKALAEVKSLQDFFQMLQTDPDRAYYGFKHVQRAADAQGVETLLVTDELFRSQDISQRAKYVSLVDQVRDNGGVVRIFSSLHVSGEQLGQLSGVAAILRYPMPDLDEDQDETSGEA